MDKDLKTAVESIKRELDMTHHMETLGSDCIHVTRDDLEVLIAHATRQAETVEVLKEVRDGLDIIKYQITKHKELRGETGYITTVTPEIEAAEKFLREIRSSLTTLINEYEGVG